MATVTVVGASGSIVPVSVSGAAALSLAQTYVNTISNAAGRGNLYVTNLRPGVHGAAGPDGKVDEGVILRPGSYTIPDDYRYITDGAKGPVTISEAATKYSVSVLAGTGGTTLIGGTGGGTFIAGGGNNLFQGAASGNYVIATGNGNDTIFGHGGNDLITDGVGHSRIFAGTGNDTIYAYGTDSITAGSGRNSVFLHGSHSTVVGGSGTLKLDDDGKNNLFVSGSGYTQIATTSGTLVLGASGADIDVTSTGGLSTLIAGSGKETLDGSFSSGSLVLVGGSGRAALRGGTGADTLFAGSGNNTLTGGSGSSNLFEFTKADHAKHTTITDFGSAAGNLVNLSGYGANEVMKALATAKDVHGGSIIKLSDNTTITFNNLTAEQLKAHGSQFFSG